MPTHSYLKGMPIVVTTVWATEETSDIWDPESELEPEQESSLVAAAVENEQLLALQQDYSTVDKRCKICPTSIETVIIGFGQAVPIGKRPGKLRREDSGKESSENICAPSLYRPCHLQLAIKYLYRLREFNARQEHISVHPQIPKVTCEPILFTDVEKVGKTVEILEHCLIFGVS